MDGASIAATRTGVEVSLISFLLIQLWLLCIFRRWIDVVATGTAR
jgi:hypothetical protein